MTPDLMDCGAVTVVPFSECRPLTCALARCLKDCSPKMLHPQTNGLGRSDNDLLIGN